MRMDSDHARRSFDGARVARLATVDRSSAPHLVPVTFAVIPLESNPRDPADTETQGALIVFAIDHKPKSTTALRRLENIAANPMVSFLVDHYVEDWTRLWWVRADAVAGIVEGVNRTRAIAALQTKYPQYQQVPPGGIVVGGSVTKWVGWQAADS